MNNTNPRASLVASSLSLLESINHPVIARVLEGGECNTISPRELDALVAFIDWAKVGEQGHVLRRLLSRFSHVSEYFIGLKLGIDPFA